jgi:hypothetical protein
MSLRDRIGIDIGRRLRLEDGIEWAARNAVRHIDVQLDTAANAVTAFGSLEDMLAARDDLVEKARAAGVARME